MCHTCTLNKAKISCIAFVFSALSIFYHFASWCLGTHSFCTLMHVLFKCYYYYLFICQRIKTPTTLSRVSWRFFFSLSFTFCKVLLLYIFYFPIKILGKKLLRVLRMMTIPIMVSSWMTFIEHIVYVHNFLGMVLFLFGTIRLVPDHSRWRWCSHDLPSSCTHFLFISGVYSLSA